MFLQIQEIDTTMILWLCLGEGLFSADDVCFDVRDMLMRYFQLLCVAQTCRQQSQPMSMFPRMQEVYTTTTLTVYLGGRMFSNDGVCFDGRARLLRALLRYFQLPLLVHSCRIGPVASSRSP